MGKPLSRPDCLRQSPRCLGKGDEEEAYIEDCYVPQRSIYDTMRINEQIDQGTKLCQPSRSTLGSGGEARGEGSTLSSNGTIGADLGGVFVSRSADGAGGVKKLDERVIFDALKLTGDAKMMSPAVVGSGMPIPSSSGAAGAAAVAKRRHQGGDKRDNPNRRSWKAFMPPSFPEFPTVEGGEKRLSGAGIPLAPSLLPPSTPTSPPLTPPVCSSPAPTSVSPPLSRQKQFYPLLQRQTSPPQDPVPATGRAPVPQLHPSTENKMEGWTTTAAIRHIPEEALEAIKTSDSERDSPLLDQDQGDSAPLIPPQPVFCPPTKARTWPRSMTAGKRTPVRHNFPVLPPLPPLLGEDNTDEESVYLLDPPSPFLKEEEELVYGGLPLSPCVSQEGGEEGLLVWGDLRERTASELKFEEDERRILEELEEEEEEEEWRPEGSLTEEERAQREEREWEAVLKLENRDLAEHCWDGETLGSDGWDLTGSSGHWPLLTPPTGFRGPEAPSASPGTSASLGTSASPDPSASPGTSASPDPSSGEESVDLFLELEKRCQEEEEGAEMSVDPEPLCDPYSLPEEEEDDEGRAVWADFEEKTDSLLNLVKDHENEHGFIDDVSDFDYAEKKMKVEEEEASCQTDSALGQQEESDSSGVLGSQPDRTGFSNTNCVDGPEPELDSGASSQRDEEEGTASSSSPAEEEEEELGADRSEPSPDNSEAVPTDDSHEPRRTTEKETDSECTQEAVAQEEPGEDVTMETGGTEPPSAVPREDRVSGVDVGTPRPDGVPDPAPSSSSAFVISDSFVYLAVSAPPHLSDCPPSPAVESSPPSPVPKPSPGQNPEEEDGSFLSPDSFVYMAAPERPRPGPADVGWTFEDTPDLDSYSEGTQSGVDGVEFVLGSMTGDSDWESDGSALDFPCRDEVWDQLEPGLLQSLFTQPETSQVRACGPQEDWTRTGPSSSPTDLTVESEPNSKDESESSGLSCFDAEQLSEVCFYFENLRNKISDLSFLLI